MERKNSDCIALEKHERGTWCEMKREETDKTESQDKNRESTEYK